MEENMKRASLIRLSGLAAMAGGLAATTLGLAVWLSEPPYSWSIPYLDSASNAAIQTLVNVSDVLVIAGALAAIAALHTLHGGLYEMTGTLVSLVAFVGVVVLLLLGLGDVLRWSPWFSRSPVGGYALAALGGMGLGAVTMVRRVAPWWWDSAHRRKPRPRIRGATWRTFCSGGGSDLGAGWLRPLPSRYTPADAVLTGAVGELRSREQ